MSADRLLPCPFCGTTKNETVDHAPGVSMHSYPSGYRVECEKCGATGPWDNDDAVRALALWDARSGFYPFATGELVRAGEITVGGETFSGLWIAMTREELQAIKRLPMYRRVELRVAEIRNPQSKIHNPSTDA